MAKVYSENGRLRTADLSNAIFALIKLFFTCRRGVVHADIVVLSGHWLLHEGLVKNDAIHFDMVIMLDQGVF